MSFKTEIVKAFLPRTGKLIHLEANMPENMDPNSLGDLDFGGVTTAIEGIADAIDGAIKSVAPQKVTLALSIEASIEQGGLTALIAKGSGKGGIVVTLEWVH